MTRRDGDQDDEPAPRRERERGGTAMSRLLRDMLGDVGIELDDPEPARPARAVARAAAPVNRDEIRAVLEQLGYPEWAIASCPNIEYARAAKPWEDVALVIPVLVQEPAAVEHIDITITIPDDEDYDRSI